MTQDLLRAVSAWKQNGLLSWTTLYVAVAVWIVYLVGLAVYRLAFSPLANIPGPKLAVHFNDPKFIDPLFPGPARKTDKYMFTGRRTGTQNSIVATVDHDLHRKRRNTINVFLSSASIRWLEPIMQESMANLLRRMDQAGRNKEVLPMHYVIKACISDVITKFAFGDSFHFLDEEDFAAPYMKATDVFHLFNHAMCHFPIVGKILAAAPDWAIHTFIPGLSAMWHKKGLWLEQVLNIKHSPNPDRVKSTIFEGILVSKAHDEEKEDHRLAHEAQLIVFAGQGPSYTLSAAVYQLLANPRILKRAKEELAQAIPQAGQVPTYHQIETLPYFSAVVQEVLRVHPSIVSRLPRVSPDVPIIYDDKKSGKRTLYEFRPERWLENPGINEAFMGFARGTRNCIGLNFARQEVFIILATIIRKYDLYQGQEGPTLELYDTVCEWDIDVVREMIIPFSSRGSHGLRVRVRA
ncbi:cytochrome P450 [Nemania serpens]|nr:cytochrome P450 [Nemania serpens]